MAKREPVPRVKISYWDTQEQYDIIVKLAAQKKMSVSEYLREISRKGTAVDGYAQDMGLMQNQLGKALAVYFDRPVERLVKLLVKAITVSAANWNLSAVMLSEVLPVTRDFDYDELLIESKKKGAVYAKMPDQQNSQTYRSFILGNEMERGMMDE